MVQSRFISEAESSDEQGRMGTNRDTQGQRAGDADRDEPWI
jgi:hypothetical protein